MRPPCVDALWQALDDGPSHPYFELALVLAQAFEQAADGKGKERHALEGERFEDQPIVQVAEWLGSTDFPIGQAVKKALEAGRLSPGAAQSEILGSMNYLAAAFIVIGRGKTETP